MMCSLLCAQHCHYCMQMPDVDSGLAPAASAVVHFSTLALCCRAVEMKWIFFSVIYYMNIQFLWNSLADFYTNTGKHKVGKSASVKWAPSHWETTTFWQSQEGGFGRGSQMLSCGWHQVGFLSQCHSAVSWGSGRSVDRQQTKEEKLLSGQFVCRPSWTSGANGAIFMSCLERH